MEKQVHAKEALKQMEEIENEIYRNREMAKADAHHYKIMKMIESEQAQLTPQYLQKLAIESFTNNTKLYFGESIPKFISDNIGSSSIATGIADPSQGTNEDVSDDL